MMKRFATLAALTVAALSFAGQANAAYTLTLNSLSAPPAAPANPTIVTFGGTRFDFGIAGTPQNSLGNFGQAFNVLNVGNPTQTGTDNGSVTINETFTITGSDGTPGTVNGTLSGLFTVTGARSSFVGSITGLSGTGFTISNSDITYTAPTAGSPLGSGTQGNISIFITPTAVPEPTSVAVLGLGLAGLSVVSFFRRRRHATLSLDCALTDDSDATFADLVATEAPSPAREAATGEFSALVATCMEKLDARHREILTLRNLLNRSYDEIAQALGINVGTVKSRIARARGNLRALLAEACPEFSPDAAPSDWFEPNRATGRLEVAAA